MSLLLRFRYSIKGISINTVKGAEQFYSETLVLSTKSSEMKTQSLEDQSPTDSINDTPQPPTNNKTLADAFSMTLWESLTSYEYLFMYIMFIGTQVSITLPTFS
jgi:hypothetical protein